jgi:transposase
MQMNTAAGTYANELETYKQRYHQLETRNKELESALEEVEINLKEYQYKYLEIKEQYDLLVYKRFARSAERLLADEKQPLLFSEEAGQPEAAEETPEEYQTVRSFERKKAGRKPLGASLERRPRTIDIPESEKTCACGAELTKIGEEISEKLQITPPQIYVEQIVRPKYACLGCEGTEDEDKPTVRMAPVEPTIIPKSIASASLLATIHVQKFEMHLPYYRQEKQFAQIGVEISRQDMANWQQQVYRRLEPLLALLKQAVKSGPVMQMDETEVQVMGEQGRRDTQKSYMWLALGGDEDKKAVWYEYHPTRAARHAKEFLEGYSGYLQTDGYEGYDCAVKDMPGIIRAGCFAHARRKFFEAAKANKESRSADEGIKHIRSLYDIENELREKQRKKGIDSGTFLSERKARAGPALEKFKAWLEKRKEEVPPSLLLGKAICYSLNQWDKMTAYLESPHLTPDNNACENAIRPFVLGRKNWLFCQSVGGAESSCGIYSLIKTAKRNSLIPFVYLKAVYEEAPYASAPTDWEKLLPWNIFTP